MSAYLNHLVVCGYEPGAHMFCLSILNEVDTRTTSVVLFGPGERPPDLPNEFVWVSGDPTKESELDKLRLPYAAGVVLIGPRSMSPQQADATTILTAFTVRSYIEKHGATVDRVKPLFMVAEVLDAENVAHLKAAGADEAIETTRLGFDLLAHAVAMPGTAQLMSEFASASSHSLYVGRRPEDLDMDVTFGALSEQIKHTTGALLIGVRDATTGDDTINPASDEKVADDALLVYLAPAAVLPIQ